MLHIRCLFAKGHYDRAWFFILDPQKSSSQISRMTQNVDPFSNNKNLESLTKWGMGIWHIISAIYAFDKTFSNIHITLKQFE